MNSVPHKITLDLRWGGFTGSDIDEIMSEPPGENPVRCELESYSTCEGPNSYRIFIEVGVLVALVGKPFLEEFGKDLYRWAKAGLGNVFRRKRSADGWTELRFKDKTIYVDDFPGDDSFADCWLDLPNLLETTDLEASNAWEIVADSQTRTTRLEPTKKR